ncbi:MAG: hypothetical protein IPL69_20675 [Saprospiraceae bacterium]|nr:hypothetical protein [Candidatus Brachybacter algidus]
MGILISSYTLTASITDPGYILAKTEAGDHPAIVTSGIDQDKSVNRFWTITNTTASILGLDAHLTWAATDVDPSADPFLFVGSKYDDPDWFSVPVYDNDNLSITVGALQSFSDFQIGEALPPSPGEALHFDGRMIT